MTTGGDGKARVTPQLRRSRSVQQEAKRDGASPIDLINGEEIAEKLKELALGVKTELVERISVDTAWFEGI